MRTGHARALVDSATGQRTTFMRLATLSTLFDYIGRAMPWEAPKSLPPNDVYALTAYLLHLAEIVPEPFTLSHRNVAEVQSRLPNRHGMTTDHGLGRATRRRMAAWATAALPTFKPSAA